LLLRGARDDVRRHGLTDGPGPAAIRYRTLADTVLAVADSFTVNLPSAALTGLLELDAHARKHGIRLETTSRDMRRAGDYAELPELVAAVAAQAHTSNGHPISGHGSEGVPERDGRDVRATRYRQPVRERGQ
jgi:hypothetical protein